MTETQVEQGVAEILIEEDTLRERVTELGAEISDDYMGRDLLLIGVLKGAVFCMADLMRAIDAPCECDFIAVSSYGASTRSSGIVELTKDLSVPIEDRDVLIVEDIVDTGRTLAYLRRNLETPIAEMQLPVRAESRTGDTPQSRRLRQRERPPDLLMTTPESLALLLSYPDKEKFFASLRCVIVDELHSFATSKRGHHLALCLARLAAVSPRATSILLVFLGGGPSHLDMFDPKPLAPSEYRGPFSTIATPTPA